MPRLNNADRNQAIGMLDAGNSQLRVARRFHVHPSTINRLLNRYQTTGTVNDRRRSGTPRVTTDRQDRNIRLRHLRNRFLTAASTARTEVGTRGRLISARTVRRRLAAARLHCYQPYRGLILLHRHRQARLLWARNDGHLRPRRWRDVIFSDESRFNVSVTDRRHCIYRRRGERVAQACVLERDRYGGGGVMVWGAISAGLQSTERRRAAGVHCSTWRSHGKLTPMTLTKPTESTTELH